MKKQTDDTQNNIYNGVGDMCMCANLEDKYHMIKACLRLSTDWAASCRSVGDRSLATAQHLCGALVGFIDTGLVGISLVGERTAESERLTKSVDIQTTITKDDSQVTDKM